MTQPPAHHVGALADTSAPTWSTAGRDEEAEAVAAWAAWEPPFHEFRPSGEQATAGFELCSSCHRGERAPWHHLD